MTEFVDSDGVIVDENEAPTSVTLEILVERGVAVKREMALLKDDLTSIAGFAKEKFGISKRDFNALVKYSFEKDVNADIEELEAIRVKLNNLGTDGQGELFNDESTYDQGGIESGFFE